MDGEQIAASLRLLEHRMDRFEHICDGCRGNVNGKFDSVSRRMDCLDVRLRRLEVRIAFITGGAALLGTIGGALLGRLL